MATDWIATLKEQAHLAHRFAKEVPSALTLPELTIDQASRIHGMVEKGARDFGQISEDMNKEDLDDALYGAADRLEAIWSALSVMAANKVRTMQGLEPIERLEDPGD